MSEYENSAVQAFMTNLSKKTDDVVIQSATNEEIVFTTSVDLETLGMVETSPFDFQLTDYIDDERLEREAHRRAVPVNIRMLRFVFGIQMVTAMMIATIGYIIFYLLDYDAHRRVTWIACIVTSVCMCIAYGCMYWFRNAKDYIIVPTFLLFLLDVAIWCGTIASLSRTMAPLLACTTVMTQSCAVFAYSMNPKGIEQLEYWMAAGYMLVGHLVAWTMGLFVFARETAWMWSMVLFLFGIVHIAYATWQLMHIDDSRYSLSRQDRIQSLIFFYLDPAIQLPILFKTHCWHEGATETECPEGI